MLMLFVGYMTAAEHVQVQVRDPQAVFKVCDSSDPGQQWQYQQVRHRDLHSSLTPTRRADGAAAGWRSSQGKQREQR